jgi:hypothetical protein
VSSNLKQIPLYGPDGKSFGSRSIEAANRLIEGGHVVPAYGRKGHLKGIWLRQQDSGNPIETHVRSGTRYSILEKLDNGARCWKYRRLDRLDEDGVPVNTRGLFLQVLVECLA